MLIMLLFRKVADYSSAPEISETFRQIRAADACLAVALQRGDDMQTLYLTIITPVKTRQRTYSYGGPPQTSHRWAVNLCLNFVRCLMCD